jgi:hypothetical protein
MAPHAVSLLLPGSTPKALIHCPQDRGPSALGQAGYSDVPLEPSPALLCHQDVEDLVREGLAKGADPCADDRHEPCR